MSLFKKILRVITIVVVAFLLIGVAYWGFKSVLARVAPENSLVDCHYFDNDYDACSKRPDCLPITIGGIGSSPAVHSCQTKK